MAQAKAKSNSVVTTVWSGDILTINVLGGQLIGGRPADAAVMFDRSKASDDNNDMANKHGWTQKHCDRAAIPAPIRGKGMTEEQWAKVLVEHRLQKYENIVKSVEYFEQGAVNWKMSGLGGSGDGGLLLTALFRLKPKLRVDQVAAFLESRTAEQMKTIRLRSDVVEMQNQIRLERAGPIDNDDSFAELEAMGEDSVDDEIAELMDKG